MSDPTPTRKSGRQRVPNKKYTVDAFQGLEHILGSDSEQDNTLLQKSNERSAKDDQDGHADFPGDGSVAEVVPDDDDDEDMSAPERSEGSAIPTPNESDAHLSGSESVALHSRAQPVSKRASIALTEDSHSRGMNEHSVKFARTNDYMFVPHIMGSDPNDQESLYKTREKWALKVALPAKRSVIQSQGDMAYPFNHTPAQRKMEATVGWDWYYDQGGKASFQAQQELEAVDGERGRDYIHESTKVHNHVLMGPYSKQCIIPLSLMQFLSIDEAWKRASITNASAPNGSSPKEHGKRQDGWVLNAGTSVRCLEWAPNQLKETQYLAISTLPSKNFEGKKTQAFAPAYTASPPNLSSIQIWAFALTDESGESLYSSPQLRMVICTEWGHCKQFKWCPVPRAIRNGEPEDRVHLGLLAGVWSDGFVRVLDLYLDGEQGSTTRYVKYNTAAFECRPPRTLCTCVAWLSPTDIAVGCANGYLAIWNIFPEPGTPQELQPDQNRSSKANNMGNAHILRPYIYFPIHHSYVLAVAPAYPPYPHLICTSSISGHLKLTDIRSPTADHVWGQHSRFGPTGITYCAHLQCFLATHEDGQPVRCWPLRRFWAGIGLARGESELLCISAAPLHPTILCGFADGILMAFNPLKKYLGGKNRGGIPQHKIWKHEWSREMDGVSRITEGYKVEDMMLHPDIKRSAKGAKKIPQIEDNTAMSTIYEEESGVKAIAWNPNLEWGGWAATGLGSGLVRVEDLSIG